MFEMTSKNKMYDRIGRLAPDSKKRHKKWNNQYYILYSLLLYACGSGNSNNNGPLEIQDDEVVDFLSPLYLTLEGNDSYTSTGHQNEVLSADYSVFKTIDKVEDVDTSDSDELIVVASEDMLLVPKVSGFEQINVQVAEGFTPTDSIFNIDLSNFSDFEQINITTEDTSLSVDKLALINSHGSISVNSPFSEITSTILTGSNLDLITNSDTIIEIYGSGENISLDGKGKSINATTTSTGNIDITDNSSVILNAPYATGNLHVNSNGNVEINDVSSLLGNLTVSSIGTVNITDASSLEGKIKIDNSRASIGDDISIYMANNAKSVEIVSVGSATANTNNGLNEATTIKVTAAENSSISAIKNISRSVSLNSNNIDGDSVTFDIDIRSISDLSLGGISPIVVNLRGEDLSGVQITSTNSTTSTIKPTAANIDLSAISEAVLIDLPNSDGKTLEIRHNQNIALNAEIDQTSSVSSLAFNLVALGTSNSSNTLNIKMTDSDALNADNLVSIDGISLNDINILNFDLSSGTDLSLSNNITGDELTQVNLTGTGNANFNNSTIIGNTNNAVSINANNLSGDFSFSVNNTPNSVKNISTGAGNDAIEIDDALKSNPGIVINTGSGNDIITFTSNSVGNEAISSIDGGDGLDIIEFAAGLDLSQNNLTISNVEKLEFTGGSNAIKFKSDVLSQKTYEMMENGSGNLSLEVVPASQTINLSTLIFDETITTGAHKVIVNGNNYTQALTITGSSIDDEITGTYTSNDIISAGDGDDTIDGSDGNDTITPGNGSDQVTPGLGNDSINLLETYASMDKLIYTLDDGSANVDTVANFDLRVVKDVISLDVSELSTPITVGNGSNALLTNTGNLVVTEHLLDTNLDLSSGTAETIIKLMQTDQSEFADAFGASEITVADGACINFLWYDADTNEAVYGYASENADAPADNKITSADAFVEIVRLSVSDSNYIHFLDTGNFEFV